MPLMIRTVVGLTVFFFVATLGQLVYLNSRIHDAPELDISNVALPESTDLDASRLRAQILLESIAIARRYHQANVLLMSRVWARYLGFVTGMILALVGAVFILGKLQEAQTEVGASAANADFSLKTTSPGLVLAVLGVALMVTSIVTHHDIETRDTPIYFTTESSNFTAGSPNSPLTDDLLGNEKRRK